MRNVKRKLRIRNGIIDKGQDGMKIEFDVTMTTNKMYDYMLKHTFTSFSGIMGEILGMILVVGFFTTGKWMYLLAGVVCVLYQPVALYTRSKRQVASNEVFKEPLHYILDENGVTVKSGENEDSLEWNSMYKAISTNHSVILYTNRVSACIFPKEDMGDLKDDVVKMICTHMDPKQVNIKG